MTTDFIIGFAPSSFLSLRGAQRRSNLLSREAQP
jgi:hypothetical protein